MVLATEDQEIPTIVQVPRQIPRDELKQLIPTEWISNYENFKKKEKQTVATEATFRRNSVDGSVKTTFKWKNDGDTSKNPPPVFHTMMITLGDKEEKIPVHSFRETGKAIFSDKLNGHFLWDVDPSACDSDCDCYEDHDSDSELSSDSNDEDNFKKKKQCKPPLKPTRRYDPDNGLWIGIRKTKDPLLIYEREIKALRKEGYPPADPNLITWPPPKNGLNLFREKKPVAVPCMMFTNEDFPFLERQVDTGKKISTKPFVQPTEILPDGTYKPSTQAEEVLNWQTTNSLAQNNLLKVIEKKVDKMTEAFQYQLNQMSVKIQKAYAETKQKIEALEKEMEKKAERSFHENSRREQELQKLRKQVFEIEEYVKTCKTTTRKHVFTIPYFSEKTFVQHSNTPSSQTTFLTSYFARTNHLFWKKSQNHNHINISRHSF